MKFFSPVSVIPFTVAASAVVQYFCGNFPVDFFTFPLDAVAALLWFGLLWIICRERSGSAFIVYLSSAKASVHVLVMFAVSVLAIGLFPQLSSADAEAVGTFASRLGLYDFMSSWIFVTVLFWLLTNLGAVTVRRCLSPGRYRVRFVLNHLGLWLALFAGFFSAPEDETLRMPVFRDRYTDVAYNEDAAPVYTGYSVRLEDFTVSYYPDGKPEHYSAEVSVDGRKMKLEVNDPVSVSWDSRLYLVSYDTSSDVPSFCILQIVRQPLDRVMLAGIMMMLAGAVLMFVQGPASVRRLGNVC